MIMTTTNHNTCYTRPGGLREKALHVEATPRTKSSGGTIPRMRGRRSWRRVPLEGMYCTIIQLLDYTML